MKKEVGMLLLSTTIIMNSKTVIYAVNLKGDISKNGKVNAADASIVLDKYRNDNATAADLSIADMDGNGRLNAADAAIILDIYRGASIVKVTSVSVTPTSITLNKGATKQLTENILPSNATNKNVTWTSSDTTIATISSTGVVTGVKPGTATITCTTADGAKTATCTITVPGAVSLSKTSCTLDVNTTTTITLTASATPSVTVKWGNK